MMNPCERCEANSAFKRMEQHLAAYKEVVEAAKKLAEWEETEIVSPHIPEEDYDALMREFSVLHFRLAKLKEME